MRPIAAVIFISCILGFLSGSIAGFYFYYQTKNYIKSLNLVSIPLNETSGEYTPQTSQEEAIIKAVKEVSPAVVSIVISKDVPIIEEYFYNPFEEFFGPLGPQIQVPQYRQKGTQKQEIGGGSGVIVSTEGIIMTNKHVVSDTEAEYTVFTNDGKKFLAKVLARDPLQDIAILKIEQEKLVKEDGQAILKPFPVAKLGDSDNLQIGQTVIAIGNALGEFRNTVSVGVISGLGRTITASSGGMVETLEDIIQTDAAINKGNSGGPLLNLKGEIIGINTATAIDAQSIGFTIPINSAKKGIEQVKAIGKIVYPFLGIRYIIVNEKVKQDRDLSVDYGALIIAGEQGEPAVTKDSAADKAGLKEKDIILEFGGKKINQDNSLAKIIRKYSPGDKVRLRVLSGGKEKTIQIVLDERSDES